MPDSTNGPSIPGELAVVRSTLETLDLPGVTRAFNTVYQRYVVPFTMDEAQMGRHISSTAMDLAHSPLWLTADGEVAGLGALGVRGDRGWIGGFGLSPAYRGHGLGRLLLEETLSNARALGIRQVELDVLRQNDVAMRLYTRAGFRIAAELAGLMLVRPAAPKPGREEARGADPRALLARLPRLWPGPTSWQREPLALAASGALAALVVGSPERPDGYLLYRRTPAVVSIMDIGATDARTVAMLVDTLRRRIPERSISLNNEPIGGVVHAALMAAGWMEIWRQQRMVIPL